MSSKRVKVALKLAKQEIQKKSFEEAIPHCKEVLEDDPRNYNAHVFLGLCYGELLQLKNSQNSYHSAIELMPDEILAYQGLGNLYTKHWKGNLTQENIRDKIFAHENLLRLTDKKNVDKVFDFALILSKSFCEVESYQEAIDVLKVKAEYVNSDEKEKLFLKAVVDVISSSKNPDTLKDYFNFAFKSTIKFCSLTDIPISDKENAISATLLISPSNILRDNQINDLIVACENLCKEDSVLAMDILIQLDLQNQLGNMRNSLNVFIEKLSTYTGPYKDILAGYNLFRKGGQHQKVIQLLEEGLKLCPDFLPAFIWLNKTYNYLHKYTIAQVQTRSALQLCKNIAENKLPNSTWLVKALEIFDLKTQVMKCQAEALSNSHDVNNKYTAVDLYQKILDAQPDCISSLIGISKVLMSLNRLNDAMKYIKLGQSTSINNPVVGSLSAYLQFLNEEQSDVIGSLATICEKNPECFESHFYLATVMWKKDENYRNDKSKCLATFLKAAKLDPYDAETFLYIGNYYRDVARDNSRAKRCFQKSFDLDPQNDGAGAALADQFTAEGDFDSAIFLYEKITNSSAPGGQKWAWLRLGLCRLKTKESTSAITCFQAALRADSSDYVCWECLGEGYLSRGSYTAAWKSFNKANELNPLSVYSVYQMAVIKQALGYHDEAIEKYFEVLKLKENYVPALQGLGESFCSLARQMLSEGRFLSCVDRIQQAINYLSVAVHSRSDLSCIWKLLGDCCTIIHPVHWRDVKLSVPTFLVEKNSQNSTEAHSTTLDKFEVLKLGGVMYSRALNIHKTAGLLWHDLGLNYFYQSKESQEKNEATHLATKSVSILQKALQCEPDNHLLWNSLGVVAASKLVQNKSLAQHCFICSIECEANNCQAWNNLGTLYIEQSEIELAHRAFKVAQSLEPSFVNAWIGQAYIAEVIGSNEVFDLFQHSVSLSLHEQASTGYASMICKTLFENESKADLKYTDDLTTCNSLSLAIEQLSKYTNKYPDCAWAASMHGYVLEKSGFNKSAETAYLNCYAILSSENKSSVKLNKARSNYARILRKNQKYRESIKMYKEIGSDNCSVDELCGFALNLFYLKEYESSLGLYEQATELSTDKNEQLLISCAKSIVLWNMGNKKQAYDKLSNEDSSHLVTQLLLAMAILMEDTASVKRFVGKINQTNGNLTGSCDDNLNRLLILASLENVDSQRAVVLGQKFIHRFPQNYHCRRLLTKLVLNQTKVDMSHAHTQSTLMLQSYTADERNWSVNRLLPKYGQSNEHEKLMTLHTLSALAAGKHSLNEVGCESANVDDSLKSAQRLIHSHPYNHKSWTILSSACYAKAIYYKVIGSPNGSRLLRECQKLSHYMAKKASSPKEKNWLIIQHVMACIANEECEKATDVISQITEPAVGDMLLTFCELCQDFKQGCSVSKELSDEMENLANSRSSTLLTLKIVSSVFESLMMPEKAYSTLEKLSQKSGSNLHLQLAYCALQIARSQSSKNEKEKWSKKVNENLGKVKNRNSSVSQLIDGLCYKALDNKRKEKVALNRVLNMDCGHLNQFCQTVAAWNLFILYQEKDDELALQDLIDKWAKFDNVYLDKIQTIYSKS